MFTFQQTSFEGNYLYSFNDLLLRVYLPPLSSHELQVWQQHWHFLCDRLVLSAILHSHILVQKFLQHSRLYWWDGNVWIYSKFHPWSPPPTKYRKFMSLVYWLYDRSPPSHLMGPLKQYNLECSRIFKRKINLFYPLSPDTQYSKCINAL